MNDSSPTHETDEDVDIPPFDIPLTDIEEITKKALQDVYTTFQDDLYAIETEAKKNE